MDADTTTKNSKPEESSAEEVTTTSTENNLTGLPFSDAGIGTTADGKVKNSGEAKQLEIVIMEEIHNENDLTTGFKKDDVGKDERDDKQSDIFEDNTQNEANFEKNDRNRSDVGDSKLSVTVSNEETMDRCDISTKGEDGEADSSMPQESKQLEEAPDSSVDVDASEQEEESSEETKRPRRRGRSLRTLDASIPRKGRVEKVLQMKYKRSIKHYLVHWADTGVSEDSWLILNPSIEGFVEQVKAFDEERKKANDRGEGASSKQTSRTKHSWYYLSSSEDEDSILKDNFWKNLDEGKLNLYQTCSDMYSSVKEIGRAPRSYNQEVHAIIPEDYLAETKRVTRSSILTPAVKRTKKTDAQKNNESDHSAGIIGTEKRDRKDGSIRGRKNQKAPTKTLKKESKSTKRECPKKSGSVAKKLKAGDGDVSSRISAASEEEEDDDMVSEDNVSEMLVPIDQGNKSVEKQRSDIALAVETTKQKNFISKTDKKIAPLKSENESNGDNNDNGDDNNNDNASGSGDECKNNDERKERKVEITREEKLKHLEECIDAVIEASRSWYEEHFGEDDSDDESSKGKCKEKEAKEDEIIAGEGDDAEDVTIKKIKGSSLKRKKGCATFIEEKSKKRKVKKDPSEFQEEVVLTASIDDIAFACSQIVKKEDEKCNENDKEGDLKVASLEESDIKTDAKTDEIKASEADGKTIEIQAEIDNNAEGLNEDKDDKEKLADDKKLLESVQPLLMDQQSKMELAKKVSQYIMKGTLDKKDGKTSSDEASKPSLGENVTKNSSVKDEHSEMCEKLLCKKESDTVRKLSSEDQKLSKEHKKSGQPFNLKLMRNEDILSKREKMARTHIDSSRPTNVQFLMAIKSNDIVKVKTMLENVAQINLEFIDMKTGLSLVWLAVKNNLMSILILLATHGADIEKRNRDGFTPLIYAADKGFFQIVHSLCHLGANLYATAPDGETAIVKAVKNRHKTVVQILFGVGISLGENPMAEKNLIQLAKHVGSNDIIEVMNIHKARLNKELLLRASQCFESSVKIDQQVFPIQCFRMVDSRHFKVFFRHEIQPTKKTRGMLLFIGQGQVMHNDVSCSLRGRSQVTKALLNEQQLQSISDDMNFIFAFSPLVEGPNRLDIYTQPLSRENYQTNLIVCAYTVELNLGITPQ